jgi:glycosyltransferase involved in cell wall biosynthesis
LAKFMRSKRIEVVHTHNPLVHHYGVLCGRLGGARVIVNTLHGPGNLDDSRKTRLVYEASCAFSTQVVSVCQALDARLKKVTLAAGRRTAVIPNGVSLDRFTSIHPRVAGEEFVFGAVGRLVPVKDHETLLRAFKLVSANHPGVRLEILGDGPLRAHLTGTANQLGIADRVRLALPTLDVAAFLARLHAFVICSLSEGLPLTLIEGMAAALPVVATSVGGMPELVLGAGCGWLASPANAKELASRMEAAITSRELAQMGMRGRRYALEYHSLDAMTDGYERLFENLLNNARSGHANPSETLVTDASETQTAYPFMRE